MLAASGYAALIAGFVCAWLGGELFVRGAVGLVKLIGGELRTGLLIGFVLAALALVAVWAVFGQPRLAVAVALALAAASVVASAIGLTLPWSLSRLGSDPAYGSGPLATIVQDVLILLIYFGCVHAIVLS
jgi:magnesium transporter